MRKLMIPLLMASVVLPTAATARERNLIAAVQETATGNRKDNSSDDRPQHGQRTARPERSQNQTPPKLQRLERSVGIDQAATAQTVEQPRKLEGQRIQRVDRVRRRTNDNLVDGIRTVARDHEADRTATSGRTSMESHIRTPDGHRWSSDWRRDHRYNWRLYRNTHRSLFRIGRYYDPYNWGYRRFNIGFSIGSGYYGSNYWLDDPWMYRLPPAYGPYRWVRYYDDALLVNIYTGQVVDVIYSFFW